MVRWIGFVYAAIAALGHSGIDSSRKLASQKLNPTELVALVGVLDAVYLTCIVVGLRLTPSFPAVTWPLLRILIASAAVKILAGVMYQKALQVSPLSATVPYFAFVPALILLTGFLLLGEVPSLQGILGVCIVTFGGYLLALNSGKGPKAGLGQPKTPSNRAVAEASTATEVDQGVALTSELVLDAAGLSGQQQAGGLPKGQGAGGLGPGISGDGSLSAKKGKAARSGYESPPRTKSATSTPQATAALSLPSAAWDVSKAGRNRLGIGLGIGLTTRDRIEVGEEDGTQSLSHEGTPLVRSAESGRGAKDIAIEFQSDEQSKLKSALGGLAARTHVLSMAAFLRSGYTGVLEKLKAVGVDEGTLLMFGCVICLSLTNGFDKLGIHNSPSVVVFAWLQRLFMGFPPAAYLLFVSPGAYSNLIRHFRILSVVSFFEIVAIIFYLKSVEWLLVSYAVAAKRINILVSVLAGYFIFKENIWRRLPYILMMMFGMLLVVFAPT